MWFLLKNISKIQQKKILTVTGTLIIVDLSWTGRKRIPQFASRISSRIFDASKPSDSCDKLSHPWCCRRGILSSKDIWVHLRTPEDTWRNKFVWKWGRNFFRNSFKNATYCAIEPIIRNQHQPMDVGTFFSDKLHNEFQFRKCDFSCFPRSALGGKICQQENQ